MSWEGTGTTDPPLGGTTLAYPLPSRGAPPSPPCGQGSLGRYQGLVSSPQSTWACPSRSARIHLDTSSEGRSQPPLHTVTSVARAWPLAGDTTLVLNDKEGSSVNPSSTFHHLGDVGKGT